MHFSIFYFLKGFYTFSSWYAKIVYFVNDDILSASPLPHQTIIKIKLGNVYYG